MGEEKGSRMTHATKQLINNQKFQAASSLMNYYSRNSCNSREKKLIGWFQASSV
jgi:hypothetical protein